MDNHLRKENPRHTTENYKPADLSKALKLIHGKWSKQNQMEALRMEARLVTMESFDVAALKAMGSMKNFELGKDVRRVWHELQAIVKRDGIEWNERDIGYVFIPQWVTEHREELELFVGIKIESIERIPAGVEILSIPTRTYATVQSYGDREQMNRAYAFIEEWVDREGYVRDTDEGVYGIEPNRLTQINPFDIPADKIDRFDFDIMIAIQD